MYDNIGGSIKNYSAVIGGISIVCGILGAVICLIGGQFWLILLCILAGFAGYIATWPLYAMGQVTEDMEAVRESAQYNALLLQELRLLREQVAALETKDTAPRTVSDELPDL